MKTNHQFNLDKNGSVQLETGFDRQHRYLVIACN